MLTMLYVFLIKEAYLVQNEKDTAKDGKKEGPTTQDQDNLFEDE